MRRRHFLWLALLLLAAGLLLWWTDVLEPPAAEPARDELPSSDDASPSDAETRTVRTGLTGAGPGVRGEEAPAPSLRPPERIQGQVRDAVTGKPIAAAHIETEMATGRGSDGRTRVRPFHAREMRATTTDADGRFACRLVPGPTYRLYVTAAGHAPARTEPTSAGSTIIIELHPLLLQGGRVVSAGGAGIAGAVLRFRVAHAHAGVSGWRPPVAVKAATDARGTFEAALGARVRYHVTITHAEHAVHEQWFLSRTEGLEFEMERGTFVRGRVGSASDRMPLAGAWIHSGYGLRGYSDIHGAFRVSVPRGRLLYVGAEGHATQAVDTSTGSSDLQIWLALGRPLRGTVEVPDGVSPGGLALEVRGYGANGTSLEVHKIMTDESGAYQVEAAGRSAVYVVVCRAPGLQGVRTVAAPADLDEVDLGPLRVLPAEVVLRGVVTGPAPPTRVLLYLRPRLDAPQADGVHSWRLRRRYGSRVVFADAAGRFVVEGLAAGNYELTAKAEGWPDLRQDVTLPTKADSLALTMKGHLRIRGRLVDSKGRPLAGHACDCGAGPGRATAVTDAEGRFELRQARPFNVYAVEFRTISMDSRVVLRVNVRPGDHEQIFRALGPADIQGKLVLAGGSFVSAYTVEALVHGRVVATAPGDGLGFILRDIKAPSVDLRIRMTRSSGDVVWQAEASGVAPGARGVILERR